MDADSIILNHSIPPELFLPPEDIDDIHVVATKDHNGLNTGIMFLRVHSWTVNMLIESIANPLFYPEIDLGRLADQTSMAQVLEKETGGPDGTGYKSHCVYMPRILFNAYEFSHGFEGVHGTFLVHFPGLENERWEHMSRWLDIMEGEGREEWQLSIVETNYAAMVYLLWDNVREAKRELKTVERKKGTPMDKAARELELALWEEAHNETLVTSKL